MSAMGIKVTERVKIAFKAFGDMYDNKMVNFFAYSYTKEWKFTLNNMQ